MEASSRSVLGVVLEDCVVVTVSASVEIKWMALLKRRDVPLLRVPYLDRPVIHKGVQCGHTYEATSAGSNTAKSKCITGSHALRLYS